MAPAAILSSAATRHRPTRWWFLVPLVPALGVAAGLVWMAQPWSSIGDDGPDRQGLAWVVSVLSQSVLTTLFIVWALLPYVVVAVLMKTIRSHPLWWTVCGYGVLMGIGGIVGVISMITSESSTSALLVIFLPIYQFGGLLVAVVVGALAHLVARRRAAA